MKPTLVACKLVMASELGRVAQTAVRTSTTTFRASASQRPSTFSHPLQSTCFRSMTRSSTSVTNRSASNWADPSSRRADRTPVDYDEPDVAKPGRPSQAAGSKPGGFDWSKVIKSTTTPAKQGFDWTKISKSTTTPTKEDFASRWTSDASRKIFNPSPTSADDPDYYNTADDSRDRSISSSIDAFGSARFDPGELSKRGGPGFEIAPARPRVDIRCVPRAGRTIHVERDGDVARAFRTCEMRAGANRVRRDEQMQRRHERPGLKRKRLRSERWAKRFMAGFQGTTARVTELVRQGW